MKHKFSCRSQNSLSLDGNGLTVCESAKLRKRKLNFLYFCDTKCSFDKIIKIWKILYFKLQFRVNIYFKITNSLPFEAFSQILDTADVSVLATGHDVEKGLRDDVENLNPRLSVKYARRRSVRTCVSDPDKRAQSNVI